VKDTKNISIFEQAPDVSLGAEAAFEPGFGQTRSLNQDYSNPEWCEGLLRNLDRQILRTPGDLTTHVQRINALLAAGYKGERVFAAALDINAVLGGKGLALQRRIHDQIFPVLDDQQRSVLVSIRSGAAIPADTAVRYCLLPRYQENSVQLVAIKRDEVAGIFSSVDFDIG
jgi:hypothetical protein